MQPRLPPNLEIVIRGAAGVICVQWRQAMTTGHVKGGQAAHGALRPGGEAETRVPKKPVPRKSGEV